MFSYFLTPCILSSIVFHPDSAPLSYIMEQLISLYTTTYGTAPYKIDQLPKAGSNRTYYRLYDSTGNSVIGVTGTSQDENIAFITLAKHFATQQIAVPKVIAASADSLHYIQQDLGSCSLYDTLKGGRENNGEYNEHELALLINTIKELPKIQFHGAQGINWNVCYPIAEYDSTAILFDLNYFKYCFLKATGLEFHEMKLENDLQAFTHDLMQCCNTGIDTFMYRDFQARNIMLGEDGTPYFIDFQGGRKGPFYYDLASFLWQASAKYSNTLREKLAHEYYSALKQYTDVPEEKVFNEHLKLFALFRTLQVLGAYGFRGYFERKQYFINSIPPAIKNLRKLLNESNFPYPYLTELLKSMTELPQFAEEGNAASQPDLVKGTNPSPSKYDGQGPLVVRVFSFSYKKGIPEDESGNGGGYVFDCRSTHNPGRYEPYKKLTGLDQPVIRFLEEDGEITRFLKDIYSLADRHVERYIERGFTSLMFAFGCTGGQHRSVYSAQHLAEHIHHKFGIKVIICHREQGISCTLQ